MKVLHVIEGFTGGHGGIASCTVDLLNALQHTDNSIRLLTPVPKNDGDLFLGEDRKWVDGFKNDLFSPVGFSKNAWNFLKDNDSDIYHINGLWQYIDHLACSIARKKGKPYLITPHGMLYPEALARSSWKKKPLRKLWFDKDIRNATCIHATCEAEMKHIRKLGYKGPIALIGNPVAIPTYTEQLFNNTRSDKRSLWGVAFLGRLHPRKKVENLLSGVAQSGNNNVEAYVIGKGDEEYEQFLRTEAQRFGIEKRVHFLGFLSGRDKFEKLAKMDALFVPSDMENFGMIIPEALIVGTPVMASLGTPWEVLNTERCGWWCDNSPETIAKVINELVKMSPEQHQEMGKRGRDYILRTFAADKIAAQMLELYKWIKGEASKPKFVYEE